MDAARKERVGWYFYDWANSAYPLVINTAIFPIFYSMVCKTGDSDYVDLFSFSFYNAALYSYTIAASYLLVSMITPVLSGVADYSGRKKRFLRLFCLLGSASCACLALFNREHLALGLAAVMGASIGFSASLVFYNAFLPEIATAEEQDAVSARGYAMGYIGSSLLLIVNVLMLQQPQWFGFATDGISQAQLFLRIAPITFVMVALWWFGWSQLTLAWLRDRPSHADKQSMLLHGFRELQTVWKSLRTQSVLKMYLAAFFVYSMGVQTVLLVSTFFGTQVIGMKSGDMIAILLLLQFVAVGGSFLFSWLSRKVGNIQALMIAVVVWAGVCVAASLIQSSLQFSIVSLVVGLVMGGIQSLSRSTYSKFLTETQDHASYFSFYDICEKVGIVFGMLIYGKIADLTGNMRNASLALMTFFVIGFILLVVLQRRIRTEASSAAR